MEWIPRTFNQKADYYSTIIDFDDWCVSNDYFRAIDSRWGPFTEDRSFRSYILDFLYVAEGKQVFVHGANKNCILGF